MKNNFVAGSHQVVLRKKILFFSPFSLLFSLLSFSFFGLLRWLPNICMVWIIWLLQSLTARSCSPKEGRANLIDHWKRHIHYNILENQKLDVKKHSYIGNILVNFALSNAWFEGDLIHSRMHKPKPYFCIVKVSSLWFFLTRLLFNRQELTCNCSFFEYYCSK